MHHSVKALCAFTVLGVLLSSADVWGQCEPGQCWPKVNNGNYIDAGESVFNVGGVEGFTSYRTSNGDLFYFIQSKYTGTVTGWLTADRRWEFWTNGGWQDEPGTAATGIGHGVAQYWNIDLFERPECANSLIGVASAVITYSGYPVDTHGTRVNFAYDPVGACFPQGISQWRSGTSYDPWYLSTLIYDRNAFWEDRMGGDFAYDPDSSQGIRVGTLGFGHEGYHQKFGAPGPSLPAASETAVGSPTQRCLPSKFS